MGSNDIESGPNKNPDAIPTNDGTVSGHRHDSSHRVESFSTNVQTTPDGPGIEPEQYHRKPSVRQHCRVSVSGLRTSQGEVIDISPAGIRLRIKRWRPWRTGENLEVTFLADNCGWKYKVNARVIWSRRVGLLWCEAGLELSSTDQLSAEQFFDITARFQHGASRSVTAQNSTDSSNENDDDHPIVTAA